MLGPKQFALLKRGAYFVAVSRGGLFDNLELARALESGRLAGAGLDVTDPEPLPPGHPLRRLPNVILTPHLASRSDKSRDRMNATIKANILRFCNGQPLLNVVDKKKGY